MALTNGIISIWHMNNNWQDSWGTNHGTAAGAIFSTSAKLGSHAGSFDGIDDFVQTPLTNFPSGNSPRTISAWIKKPPQAVEGMIFNYGTAQGWNFGDIQFFISTASNKSWFGTPGVYAQGTSIVTDNLWHLIVGTWDGNTFKIYVDNILEGSASTTPLSTPLNKCVIGMNVYYGYHQFFGFIDDINIWNRALSQGEVTELWNNGNGIEVGVVNVNLNPFVPHFVTSTNIPKAVLHSNSFKAVKK